MELEKIKTNSNKPFVAIFCSYGGIVANVPSKGFDSKREAGIWREAQFQKRQYRGIGRFEIYENANK